MTKDIHQETMNEVTRYKKYLENLQNIINQLTSRKEGKKSNRVSRNIKIDKRAISSSKNNKQSC